MKNKIFEYSKRNIFVRVFELILYVFGYFFFMFAIDLGIYYIAEYIFDGMDSEFSAVAVVCVDIVATIVIIVCIIRYAVSLKGVLLFEDHFEIKASFLCGSPFVRRYFKSVSYQDIEYAVHIGNFYSDFDARPCTRPRVFYGNTSLFASNYFGGKINDCIKIVLKSHRVAFLSCKDNEALIEELRQRKLSCYAHN